MEYLAAFWNTKQLFGNTKLSFWNSKKPFETPGTSRRMLEYKEASMEYQETFLEYRDALVRSLFGNDFMIFREDLNMIWIRFGHDLGMISA